MVLCFYILPVSLMIDCFCHMTALLRRRMRQTAPADAMAIFGHAKMNIVMTLVLLLITVIVCWTYDILIYLQAIVLIIYHLQHR